MNADRGMQAELGQRAGGSVAAPPRTHARNQTLEEPLRIVRLRFPPSGFAPGRRAQGPHGAVVEIAAGRWQRVEQIAELTLTTLDEPGHCGCR